MRPASASGPARQPGGISRVVPVFFFLAVALILGWLLLTLKFLFMPILLALFATFFFNPPVVWLQNRGVPRPVGIALTLILTAAVLWLGGKYISASFIAFRDGFPRYEERIQDLVGQARTITEHFAFITPERLKAAVSGISLSALVGNTLNSFISVISYVMVTLMFLLYFLPAMPSLPEKIHRAFPDKRGPLLRRAIEDIGRQVQSYIWAKTLTSLLTGLGVAVPCLLFGVDFALTWGVFAVLLNFIPAVGGPLSVIPPVVVCALQPDLGGAGTALWLLGALMLLMSVNNNVVEPRMLGQSVNLSPTASLLALFLWGWLWGAVGMVIAVPATAVIKVTCDNIPSLKPIGVLLGN